MRDTLTTEELLSKINELEASYVTSKQNMFDFGIALMRKLDLSKRASGFVDSDIATILDVTSSYITHMRRRGLISPSVMKRIVNIVVALNTEMELMGGPLYRKSSGPLQADLAKRNEILQNFTKKYKL